MFGNNSEKEENDIPIKIRLWCFPFIQNNNCQLEFKLKQIDERYYKMKKNQMMKIQILENNNYYFLQIFVIGLVNVLKGFI
ncbi:unnamed protein product [Meloidogyne enterolobii]|uniref:Uncharacterized protein n=1 Tax=Meloidogyne enterolobii TaxID=390850 RepID=A0ACB0YYE4_MELEN